VTTSRGFDPSKDRHQEMANQVLEVIEHADEWLTTPELARETDRNTAYSEGYIRPMLYGMIDYLESEGVDTKKESRDGAPGGDPAWHFKKEVSDQE